MSKAKRKQRDNAKLNRHDFLVCTYDSMQNRVAGHKDIRYLGLEIISRVSFYEWAQNRVDFNMLFLLWKEGGHKLKLKPTVDRIDSSRGYMIENMRWLTFSENSRLGGMYIRNKVR